MVELTGTILVRLIVMKYFEDFLSLIYPNTCAACGNNLFRHEKTICTPCLYYLPRTNFHLDTDNPVSRVFWGRCDFFSAASYLYFRKGGRTRHLIHNLKYKGEQQAGTRIGNLFGKDLLQSPLFCTVEVVIPVPLHIKKQKQRGYNQSEVFGAGIASGMNIAMESKVLYRTEHTETQTRKSRFSRWQNVSGKFALRNPENLEGKHVLLVDDVITTGATIEACVNVLSEIPGTRISIGSIAYASI